MNRTLQSLAATGPLSEFGEAVAAAGELPPSSRLAVEFIVAARIGDWRAARLMVPALRREPSPVREGLVSVLRRVPERSDPGVAATIDELIAEFRREPSGLSDSWREMPRAARLAVTGALAISIGVGLGWLTRPIPVPDLGVSTAAEPGPKDPAKEFDAAGGSESEDANGPRSVDDPDTGYGRPPDRYSAAPAATGPDIAPTSGAAGDSASSDVAPSASEAPAPPSPSGDDAPPLRSPFDSDQDGVFDAEDPCPRVPHQFNVDTDLDGVPNECDNCPDVANPRGPDGGQPDLDGDGIGDACESDDEVASDGTDPPARGRAAFGNAEEARRAIAGVLARWEARSTGRGSERECETLRAALATLAGAVDRLAFDLAIARTEIIGMHQEGIGRRDLILNGRVDERIEAAEVLFGPCLSLLQQVCLKAPAACLEGDPIGDSGLVAIGGRLEWIAKEFGKPQFRFRGDPAKPRPHLESTRQGILALRGLWTDFARDIRSSLNPAWKRYSPFP